jgi:hypothetical protein
MTKFSPISVVYFFFLVLPFFVSCSVQTSPCDGLEITEEYILYQFSCINRKMISMLFPLPRNTNRPFKVLLPILEVQIKRLVATYHSSFNRLLSSRTPFFRLLFWSIYSTSYSKKKIRPILRKIQSCGAGTIGDTPEALLKKLKEFALEGMELAWNKGLPCDQYFIDIEKSINCDQSLNTS